MTDIAVTGPIAECDAKEIGPKRTMTSWGAAFGAFVGSVARAVGDAFALAYVAPYERNKPTPPVAEEGEGGRDPSW